MQCVRSFHVAERTPAWIEAMPMMIKGPVKRLGGRDSVRKAQFVEGLFGVTAGPKDSGSLRVPQSNVFNRILVAARRRI